MVKEMMGMLGKEVVVNLGGVYVYCQVTDARESYGQQQIEISPMAGAGKVWKNLTSVIEVRGGQS